MFVKRSAQMAPLVQFEKLSPSSLVGSEMPLTHSGMQT